MIKTRVYPFVNTLSVPGPLGDRNVVTGVLEADEVKQINIATDESAAMEEEDDELEEQNRVEAAAAANRG